MSDVTVLESFGKMLGLQPESVASKTRRLSDEIQDKGMVTMMEAMIADRWAAGLAEKDPAKVQAARDALAAWNRNNPETPIRIKPLQITRRVRRSTGPGKSASAHGTQMRWRGGGAGARLMRGAVPGAAGRPGAGPAAGHAAGRPGAGRRHCRSSAALPVPGGSPWSGRQTRPATAQCAPRIGVHHGRVQQVHQDYVESSSA